MADTTQATDVSEGMSLATARARIPKREIPAFWVGDGGAVERCVREVKNGQVRVLARSPGEHPIHVIAYGERESPARRANYNSALGAGQPEAYMDKAARKRPVLLFVGPVHGQETEGVTGLCNLVRVMETGQDMRGRDQARLRELGLRCRLLIVPCANPDGLARFEPKSLCGMTREDIRFWGQGTKPDDTYWGWPGCKARHPMRAEDYAFLGCYFNEAGVNPMHDEFVAPMGPEAAAVLRLAADEGPDLAVSLHSHAAAPSVLRPAYAPREAQVRLSVLAKRFNDLAAARGFRHGGVPEIALDGGASPPSFNLVSALHHACGAPSFTFECPHGVTDEKAYHVGFDEILDIQFCLYEAMMRDVLVAR
ncbi:MAG: hypothetical protein JXR37_28040 [Kiritimatiellae bacterium]|nr:hypothetical protein [Kiritimatiellia bacterium]